jgi:formate dehydrogenase subunit beta
MNDKTEKIREVAKRLLAEGKVDLVMGWKKASVPLGCAPVFVRTAEEADELVWDGTGRVNLANFLPRRTDKVGIVAAGCHARNVVGQVVEKQIPRENVYIIGVPCEGMVDPAAVKAREGREWTGAEVTGTEVIVSGDGFETQIPRAEVLMRNCTLCAHRNPPVYDELIGEPVPEQEGLDRFADIEAVETMSAADKTAYFDDLFSTCIRCYACRNACPLCYCTTCFVDEHQPQWLGKSVDDADTMIFHFLRAFHCAGRCTDCGACEAACPMNIKVRQLTRKLEKDIFELYDGYEAGMSLTATPPMMAYRMDDYGEFIK